MAAQTKNPGTGVLARVFTRVMLLVSKHVWVWPAVGAVALVLVGIWVGNQVERATREELGTRLTTVLNADIAALRLWFSKRESDAKSFAADAQVQTAIGYLAELAQGTDATPDALGTSAAAGALQSALKPLLKAQNYEDYLALSLDRKIIASLQPQLVGRSAPRALEPVFEQALQGTVGILRASSRETDEAVEPGTLFVAA